MSSVYMSTNLNKCVRQKQAAAAASSSRFTALRVAGAIPPSSGVESYPPVIKMQDVFFCWKSQINQMTPDSTCEYKLLFLTWVCGTVWVLDPCLFQVHSTRAPCPGMEDQRYALHSCRFLSLHACSGVLYTGHRWELYWWRLGSQEPSLRVFDYSSAFSTTRPVLLKD